MVLSKKSFGAFETRRQSVLNEPMVADRRLIAGRLPACAFFLPRRMPELPPARDFLISAGFGGAAALAAAIIVAVVVLFVGRRGSKRHDTDAEVGALVTAMLDDHPWRRR